MKTWQQYLPAVWLAGAVTIGSLLIAGNGSFLDTSLTMATLSLICVSLGLVYGQAGVLSVAQAAFASLGAYATAITSVSYGLPWLVGLLLAIMIPAVVAYVLARFIVRLSPLALGIATLVFSEVLRHLIEGGGDFTGGYIGIAGVSGIPLIDSALAQSIFAWCLVTVAVIIAIHVSNSMQGRALRLISRDTVLAANLGVNVTARLTAVFALGAGLAGLAGWLYAETRTFVSPESFPLDLSITVLLMVVVGGRATVLGPVVGAVVLTFILDVLPFPELEGVFYGAILIIAIAIFPKGILGTDWSRVVQRMYRPRRKSDDDSETMQSQQRSNAKGSTPSKDAVS